VSGFRRFAADLAAHAGRRGALLGFLLILGAVVEGVGILLLLPLMSVVLEAGTGNGWLDSVSRFVVALAPGESAAARLGFLLGLFVALIALRSAVILARDVLLARVQVGFVEGLRLSVVERLAGARWDAVARLRHGRITHILGADVQSCGDAAQLLLQSAVAAAMLAAQWSLVLLLSPPLALVVLVLLLLAAAALRPVLRRASAMGQGLTETNLGLVSGTTQFLGGLKLALSQDLQRGFLDEFRQAQGVAAERRVAFVRQRTAVQLALAALAGLVGAAVVFVGVTVVDAPAASLVAFLFVLARMSGPTAQLYAAVQHIFHALPAYEQVRALEAELVPAAVSPADGGGTAPEGRLELRGVVFRHGGDGRGLDGVDLVIEPGSFVGIAGPSGAGKTTLADLLVGLYPPQQGQVSVGGVPLEGAALAAWRRSIAYVSQDPFLFHDSIRRNLLWAAPQATEEEMWAALALAGAEGLVRGLPGSLEAVAGERGSLLSGGERQRIALARALVRRPRLILLDEATNAIDAASERAILQRLAALPERPTLIVIAHREESLALCERVVEIRGGRIAVNPGERDGGAET
jgi:ATP-binding cassette subfamily C protein